MRVPTGKTTRRAGLSEGDEDAPLYAAPQPKANNQMLIIGGIGGGIFLLLIIIIAAASSGSGNSTPRPQKKVVVEPPPPPPKEAPKQYNFVRNTGGFFFVCSGSDKHQDKEVIITTCPKCTNKNSFAHDDAASGWRCSICKAVYDPAAIKCDECGRAPRVTHLKKSGAR